jgi:hypothetical protein
MSKQTRLAKATLEQAGYAVESKGLKCRLWKYVMTDFLKDLEASRQHRKKVEKKVAQKAGIRLAAHRRSRWWRQEVGLPMRKARLSTMAPPNEPADSDFKPRVNQKPPVNYAVDYAKSSTCLNGKQAACYPIPPAHVVMVTVDEEPAKQNLTESQLWWKAYDSWFCSATPLGSKQQCQQPWSKGSSTSQSRVAAVMQRISKWLGF